MESIPRQSYAKLQNPKKSLKMKKKVINTGLKKKKGTSTTKWYNVSIGSSFYFGFFWITSSFAHLLLATNTHL